MNREQLERICGQRSVPGPHPAPPPLTSGLIFFSLALYTSTRSMPHVSASTLVHVLVLHSMSARRTREKGRPAVDRGGEGRVGPKCQGLGSRV